MSPREGIRGGLFHAKGQRRGMRFLKTNAYHKASRENHNYPGRCVVLSCSIA